MNIAILGGGVAAFEAAVAARAQDTTAEITLYSREAVPPYRRPALSGMVAQALDDARFYIKNAGFYAKERIGVRLGMTAEKIDPAAKKIVFAGGESAGYDRLVIAAGARPFVPPVPGLAGDKVAVLREYADLENLRARLDGNCRKVVVLGGGEIAGGIQRRAVRTQYYARRHIIIRKVDYLRALAGFEQALFFEFVYDGLHFIVTV